MISSQLSNKPDRPAGGPKQYIQGWVEFYKLRFKVTPDVLIPRPETELLVDEVLVWLRSHLNQGRTSTILDVGTGSGNIAISLAKNNPNINIIATDISSEALKIAKQNAKLHGVENKIKFIQGDLLNDLKNSQLSIVNCPLILVTNLPYIPSKRIPHLDSSVKDFEPHIALAGGPSGFDLYRKLFAQIKKKSWKPKLIIGEIDYTQRDIASYEASKYFPNAQIEIKKDLAKRTRILKILLRQNISY